MSRDYEFMPIAWCLRLREREHGVYRLYDKDRTLLYVGKTHGLRLRLTAHRKRAWWDEVAYVSWEWHAAERFAAESEATAIRREKPKYNATLTGNRYTPEHLARLRAGTGSWDERVSSSGPSSSDIFEAFFGVCRPTSEREP